MTKTSQSAVALSLLLLTGVCAASDLEDVQKTEPIRTAKFTGAHNFLAHCIYERIDGHTWGYEFGVVGDRLIVYDSVSDLERQGLNYYAMTVVSG